MNVDRLNFVLIILTVISLFALFLFTVFFKVPEISLLENNSLYLEKVISVTGKINLLEIKGENLFFSICHFSKCLPVVYFNPSKANILFLEDAYLRKNNLKVTGKLTIYNNKEEVILYKYEIKWFLKYF